MSIHNDTKVDIVAVVDTNVMLEITSCHDVFDAATELGVEGARSEAMTYRFGRMRESLILAMHLHREGLTTASLWESLVRLSDEDVVPPGDQRCPKVHYTTMMAHFVRDELLSGWHIAVPDLPIDVTSMSAAELTKYLRENTPQEVEADDELLRMAQEHDVPLITNEGYRRTILRGKKPVSLRRRGPEAGVEVVTPREFWMGKLDEHEAIEQFLADYRRKVMNYIAGHETEQQRKVARRDAEFVYGALLMVFNGDNALSDQPFEVSLPLWDGK